MLRGSCSLPVVAFLNKCITPMAMGVLWRYISHATRQARWPSLTVISMMPPCARRQTHGRGLIHRMLPNLLLLLLPPACSGAPLPPTPSPSPPPLPNAQKAFAVCGRPKDVHCDETPGLKGLDDLHGVRLQRIHPIARLRAC